MTNEEILRKVILKAVKNGWDINGEFVNFIPGYRDKDYMLKRLVKKYSYNYKSFIFEHDFAKAFWGMKKVCRICGKRFDLRNEIYKHDDIHRNEDIYAFQYHLQQMVLEEDPLKYLERFL